MSRIEVQTYAFTCPECREELEVNAEMREVVIDRGCVLCTTEVTADAFTPRSTPSS